MKDGPKDATANPKSLKANPAGGVGAAYAVTCLEE